jgi:hypothetical protein
VFGINFIIGICSNDNPWVISDIFRENLVWTIRKGFLIEKPSDDDVCDLKRVGTFGDDFLVVF